MNSAALRYLEQTQHSSGGWGYNASGDPGVEPTTLAILALKGSGGVTPTVQRAIDWLISIQHEDGGWGLNGLDARSDWHTAWVVLALKDVIGAVESYQRGLDWLASVPVYRVTNLDVIQAYNQELSIDVSLSAWPWAPGEASWVVPTALALLALREHPRNPDLESRMIEAIRYLGNRRIPGGGWNVGNPAMFDGVLPSHTVPTALSILALAYLAPEIVQPEDLVVLSQKAIEDGGVKALGWALLALRVAGGDEIGIRDLLLSKHQPEGSWEGTPHATAIALLGLEGGW